MIHNRAHEIAGAGNVLTADQLRQGEEIVGAKMKTMFMLVGANRAKHEDLRMHLQNSYTVG